eukprot:COSAG01_NODE_9128_length_2543_cov_2.834288_2_plen_413_part_00
MATDNDDRVGSHQQYLKVHGLDTLLEDLVLDLLTSRPPNPYSFMSKRMSRLAASFAEQQCQQYCCPVGGVGGGTPLARAGQQSSVDSQADEPPTEPTTIVPAAGGGCAPADGKAGAEAVQKQSLCNQPMSPTKALGVAATRAEAAVRWSACLPSAGNVRLARYHSIASGIERSTSDANKKVTSSQSLRAMKVQSIDLQFVSTEPSSMDTDDLDDLRRTISVCPRLGTGRTFAALDFPGRQVDAQQFYLASFCGCEELLWNTLIDSENLDDVTARQKLSVACVFYPDGADAIARKHCRHCMCRKLYSKHPEFASWPNQQAPWGCFWFEPWMRNVRSCSAAGQRAVVVYKRGLRGDDVRGLGESQKGEVQFLREEGIDMYAYSAEECHQLLRLARACRAPPADRRLTPPLCTAA